MLVSSMPVNMGEIVREHKPPVTYNHAKEKRRGRKQGNRYQLMRKMLSRE